MDERGPWCRRLRDLIADQTSDLGGADALADQLETHYGEETLQRFADAIGIAGCTVERYRDVFRAWKGKQISDLGRKSVYSVLRALAPHPNRESLLAENPRMTNAEAEQLVREYREQQRAPTRPRTTRATTTTTMSRRASGKAADCWSRTRRRAMRASRTGRDFRSMTG